MPSGAKKRKAAKKKQQKQTHNTNKSTNFDGSHSNSLANDERESSEEPVLKTDENVGVQINAEVGFAGETIGVDRSVEESIPVEETVKNVVSLPHESSEGAENPDVSYVGESADGKDNVSPGVNDFVEEKTEAKVIQVHMKPRDGQRLFPRSSGVSSNDKHASCGDSYVKESETNKHAEEKALISSTPMPVRPTSWTNCCGLFEVFSGGAGR